jgi:hypothetical protein
MTPQRLMLRRRLLELIYDLAVLELELEVAKDDYKDCMCRHNEVMMMFILEQKILDIKKKKYDITHTQSLLDTTTYPKQ